jgi:hypothetical protein
MKPETYILRVYRRSGGPSRQIVGRLETPGGQVCAGFASLAELAAILKSPNDFIHRADDLEAQDGVEVKVYRQEGAEDS